MELQDVDVYEACDKVRELAQARPDFVYKTPGGATGRPGAPASCQYVHRNNPDECGCIWGHALHALGVPLKDLARHDLAQGEPIEALLPDVPLWGRKVQELQDQGYSWRLAVAGADKDHGAPRRPTLANDPPAAIETTCGHLSGEILADGSTHWHGNECGARIPHVEIDDPPMVKQYLAWGGDVQGFTIVMVEDIARDIEDSHYAGVRAHERFALLEQEPDGTPVLKPVLVAPTDSETDENDYIHASYELRAPGGEVVAQFCLRIDGRA